MVTDRTLDVYLDGILAGHLTQSATGNLTFRYDDRYREANDPTPLSLSMPLATVVHRKRVVLPWLQGLLPDNDDALRAMARRFGVSPNNPFALLEHVGADAAGAVQITPRGASATDASPRASVRRVSDGDVADMLSEVVAEYTRGAAYPGAIGRFSLAGAQPKIALHRMDDGSWGVPEDATPTTHILKPVVGEFRRIDVVEQLTMRAACALGNEVARTDIVRIGEWDVLVSERYDRRRADGAWRRLHQEDLCQSLSVSPDKKYQQNDRGPGVADIRKLVQSLPIAKNREDVGSAFYRALVFNIVAGCTDAHAKNYSLMLHGRSVRLAPLYDLLTYAAYWDGRSRIHSAMSVRGEYALQQISVKSLAELGTSFGVPQSQAEDVVDTVRRRMLGAFESALDEIAHRDVAAMRVSDDVLRGLMRLPLVIS